MLFSPLSPAAFTPEIDKKRTSYLQRIPTHTHSLDGKDRRKSIIILHILGEENEAKSGTAAATALSLNLSKIKSQTNVAVIDKAAKSAFCGTK